MANQNDDIECWRNVIAELVVKAPTKTVKECIRKYDPALPSRQNKKALKSIKKDIIQESLTYLSKGKKPTGNKNDLIDKLCLKIKNYFPDICQICNMEYTYKISDPEFLSCFSCGQEVHRECYLELLKKMNLVDENEKVLKYIFNIPGLCFLCTTCQKETIIFPNDGQDSITSQNHEVQDDHSVIDDDNLNANESPVRSRQSSVMERNESEENIQRFPTFPEHKSRLQSKNHEQTTCKFFRRNACKYGISGKGCKFLHPRMCKKLIEHGTRQPRGCNKGRDCNFFHPVMCLNSLRKNECFDEDCNRRHVKGTKRNQTKPSESEKPPQHTTESQFNNTPNQHFIELIQTLRSDMDTKINAISMHLQQLISYQNRQNLQPLSQNNTPQHRAFAFNQFPHQPQNQMMKPY